MENLQQYLLREPGLLHHIYNRNLSPRPQYPEYLIHHKHTDICTVLCWDIQTMAWDQNNTSLVLVA